MPTLIKINFKLDSDEIKNISTLFAFVHRRIKKWLR
jgi:hypothetical protein